jgi:O-antigen/teichoic acid export membrane protein
MVVDLDVHDKVPKTMTSLRRNLAVAAFASGAVEMVTRMLTIVLSIGTARALQPSEVGLLGLAVIIVGVLSIVTACAETAGVVVHSRGSDVQHAWSATAARSIITACLLAVVLVSLPPLAHLLTGNESANSELMTLTHLLLWGMGLDLVATYPRVLLQRRLNLTSLVGASLLQVTGHVGLSIVLLWNGYGAMGVASSALVGGGLSAAFLWCRLFSQPGSRWEGGGDAAVWSQTWASTARVFAGSFTGYLNGRLNSVLVAAVLGPAAMSFYGMAWSLSRLPVWVLSQALALVLVPTLAHVRSETNRMERVLNESVGHAYVLLAPACAMLFVTADSLVIIVLGAKWLPIVPALRVMSISVFMSPLVIAFNGLLVATDRGHLTGLATGAQLGTFVVLVAPLVPRWGVIGAAIGELVSTIVVTVVLLGLCRLRVPEVRWSMGAAMLPVVASASGGFLASSLSMELAAGVVKIATEACVLLGGYVIIICLLGGGGRLVELAGLACDVARRPSTPVLPSDGVSFDVASHGGRFPRVGSGGPNGPIR